MSTPPAPTMSSEPAAPRPVTTTTTTADQATIGKSLVIKGEVTGSESLYIDGRVEGSINLAGNLVYIGGATATSDRIVNLTATGGTDNWRNFASAASKSLSSRIRTSMAEPWMASPEKPARASRGTRRTSSRKRSIFCFRTKSPSTSNRTWRPGPALVASVI